MWAGIQHGQDLLGGSVRGALEVGKDATRAVQVVAVLRADEGWTSTDWSAWRRTRTDQQKQKH